MPKSTLIIDSGIGNLYSVQNALEFCGAKNIVISNDPIEVLDAERVILPGVGAFLDGMSGLRAHGLDQAIMNFASSGRPLLGICLGMQLFATISYEFGKHHGLNLIPGKVVQIPSEGISGSPLKMPYIGWTNLSLRNEALREGSCIGAMLASQSIYFVHSFHVIPDDPSNILATYEYGGMEVTAAIKKDNVTGLQFHPEKSGQVGLSILASFVKE